jgi:hypothetical protein
MFTKSRHATAVAYVALFAALGGTGYAASQLPNDSVGSKQIKRAAVAKSDVRANAIDSARVQNGTLMAQDFRSGQLPQGPAGAKGDTGAKGDKGEKGDTGATGLQGPTGTVGAITVQRVDVPLPDTGVAAIAEVACPAGTTAIGGGSSVSASTSADINVTVSRPYKTGAPSGIPASGESFDKWRVVAVNPAGGTGDTTLRGFVTCAETPAP